MRLRKAPSLTQTSRLPESPNLLRDIPSGLFSQNYSKSTSRLAPRAHDLSDYLSHVSATHSIPHCLPLWQLPSGRPFQLVLLSRSMPRAEVDPSVLLDPYCPLSSHYPIEYFPMIADHVSWPPCCRNAKLSLINLSPSFPLYPPSVLFPHFLFLLLDDLILPYSFPIYMCTSLLLAITHPQ